MYNVNWNFANCELYTCGLQINICGYVLVLKRIILQFSFVECVLTYFRVLINKRKYSMRISHQEYFCDTSKSSNNSVM